MKKLILAAIFILGFLLRFYLLGQVPASLYWDEASLGYNGYSIATTLHDEHGEFLPIQRFIAFGDYKPPVYIYAAAGAIKLFGLTEFAIRLPSAVSGLLLVLVTYLLAKQLFGKEKTALVSALLIAVSPWSIQMSRAAFEANLATFLSGLGAYFFLRKKLIFASVCFALSLYTFNSHRIFVPLFVVALSIINFRQIFREWKKYLIFYVLCFILILPAVPHLLSREGSLRFQEVAWVNDLAPIIESNDRIALDNNVWWSKLIHNRRLVYAGEFIKHYTDHFRADFLFFSGDMNGKLSIQTVGELYWLDLPFLLAGVYLLMRNRSKTSLILFSWLALAPVPAAFARETPHALRILQILPVPQILVAYGLVGLLKKRKLLISFIGFLLAISVFAYLHDYYIHYPKYYAMDWQYGYEQVVAAVNKVQNNYDYVSITNTYGRPYIYFLLYSAYPPTKYWQTRNVDRDWYGFWYVHSFDKYIFDGKIPSQGKGLFVQEPEIVPKEAKVLDTIKNPLGQTVFVLYEK